jgi:hypothetical protein
VDEAPKFWNLSRVTRYVDSNAACSCGSPCTRPDRGPRMAGPAAHCLYLLLVERITEHAVDAASGVSGTSQLD